MCSPSLLPTEMAVCDLDLLRAGRRRLLPASCCRVKGVISNVVRLMFSAAWPSLTNVVVGLTSVS